MKLLKIVLLVSLIVLSSCKEKEKKEKGIIVKPKTTTLKGNLKPYFEVVNKDYNVSKDSWGYKITVEIKRNDKDYDFNTNNINAFGDDGDEDYHVGFGIELFDASSPIIIKSATEGGMQGPYSSEDVTNIINLSKGETGYIRWTLRDAKITEIKTFQITSALKAEKNNLSQKTPKTTSSLPSNDKKWDKILDEYDEYVDEYVKFYKKAMKGDASALTEYTSILAKAEKFQTSLVNAQNDNSLNTTQINRMMKIQTKMINAIK